MAQRMNTLAMLIMVQFTLLVIEFLLGMYLNLYSTVSLPLNMGADSMSSMFTLVPHMAVGVLIFVLSLIIVIYAARAENRRVMMPSILALIFVLLTGISGYAFAFVTATNLLSFVMAIGFLMTLIIYMVPVSMSMRPSPEMAK